MSTTDSPLEAYLADLAEWEVATSGQTLGRDMTVTIEIPRVSARPSPRPRRHITAMRTPWMHGHWAVQTEQLLLESRGVAVLSRHRVRRVLARLDRATDTLPTPPTTSGAAAVVVGHLEVFTCDEQMPTVGGGPVKHNEAI